MTPPSDTTELRLRLGVRRAFGLYTPKLYGASRSDVTNVGDTAAELYAALINQGRRSAAENINNQFGIDKQRLVRMYRDSLDKHGLRQQHFETNPDGTVNVDFSNVPAAECQSLKCMICGENPMR